MLTVVNGSGVESPCPAPHIAPYLTLLVLHLIEANLSSFAAALTAPNWRLPSWDRWALRVAAVRLLGI